MITLQYTGQFKGTVLLGELLAEFPEWRVPESDPTRFDNIRSPVSVHTTPTKLILTVPRETNIEQLNAVVAAHDPTVNDFHEDKAIADAAIRASIRVKFKLPPLSLTEEEVDFIL